MKGQLSWIMLQYEHCQLSLGTDWILCLSAGLSQRPPDPRRRTSGQTQNKDEEVMKIQKRRKWHQQEWKAMKEKLQTQVLGAEQILKDTPSYRVYVKASGMVAEDPWRISARDIALGLSLDSPFGLFSAFLHWCCSFPAEGWYSTSL